MVRTLLLPGACVLALVASPAAANDAELKEIRRQIEELKATYESRIRALEDRLRDAESRPAPAVPPAAPSSPASTASAFNPAISAVLAGRYASLSRDPATFEIAGFPLSGEAGPGKRGFSLGESEVTLSANVDHRFAGVLTFAVTPENEVEVEEAYGLLTAAPAGLAPKFGRFLSGVGYQNEQHAHAWDFADAPLAYQAFLGGQARTDGVQVKWVAPLEHFVELGFEAGSGEGLPTGARDKNGSGMGLLSARTGGDVGASHSGLAGLSVLRTGDTDLTGAMAVWKYAPGGNARETNLKLQAEYFRRKDSTTDASQNGWYGQGVYQFIPAWRAGVRYDRLDAGSGAFRPERWAAMLDWSPSEFSRVRLQFAQSKTLPGVTDTEWFLQYILNIGAHGAHRY